MAKSLFAINPRLDLESHAAAFARDRRVQIRDVLTLDTARELRDILARGTPWGVAVQAGTHAKPRSFRAEELKDRAKVQEVQALVKETDGAASRGDYAYRAMRYSLVEAYLGEWAPGGPHDILLEHLNDEPFLQLVRRVTGFAELMKADAHASLFGPQHFLGKHIDSHVAEGWRVAYVLNLTIDDWQPDWGGYLQFFDDEGDVETAYMPRFNSLNMFAVPQSHAVSYVPPFAPRGRYAISGWVRDR